MSANRGRKRRYQYDIALSFAGSDRQFVSSVAELLDLCGAKVFYDEWERHQLIGVNLYEYLHEVYEKKAKYCVIFISKEYVKRAWPRHELRAAESRALSPIAPYILPVRLDKTDCPGIPLSVGYISAVRAQPSRVAILLLQRLGRPIQLGGIDICQIRRKMRWEILLDGSVRARLDATQIYLGRRKKGHIGLQVWSNDKRELDLIRFRSKDRKGPLVAKIVARLRNSVQGRVYLRNQLTYGETINYTVFYKLGRYYRYIGKPNRDSFTISLPTLNWEYEIIFPRGTLLEFFRVFRITKGARVRETFDLEVQGRRPKVSFSLATPKIGTRVDIEFKFLRDQEKKGG